MGRGQPVVLSTTDTLRSPLWDAATTSGAPPRIRRGGSDRFRASGERPIVISTAYSACIGLTRGC